MRTVITLLLCFMCATANACPVEQFTSDQVRVLNKALNIAPTFLSVSDDDQTFAVSYAGLLYQESPFCQNATNEDDPSYGCGGVTPDTAYDIAGTEVSAWMLEHNETLNMNISAKRLLWCAELNHGISNMNEALFCYNHGPAVKFPKRIERDPYVRAVQCRVRRIREFINAHPRGETP